MTESVEELLREIEYPSCGKEFARCSQALAKRVRGIIDHMDRNAPFDEEVWPKDLKKILVME